MAIITTHTKPEIYSPNAAVIIRISIISDNAYLVNREIAKGLAERIQLALDEISTLLPNGEGGEVVNVKALFVDSFELEGGDAE